MITECDGLMPPGYSLVSLDGAVAVKPPPRFALVLVRANCCPESFAALQRHINRALTESGAVDAGLVVQLHVDPDSEREDIEIRALNMPTEDVDGCAARLRAVFEELRERGEGVTAVDVLNAVELGAEAPQ